MSKQQHIIQRARNRLNIGQRKYTPIKRRYLRDASLPCDMEECGALAKYEVSNGGDKSWNFCIPCTRFVIKTIKAERGKPNGTKQR